MRGRSSSSADGPAVPRLAASLILIGPVPRSDQYRVLLVRRTIKAKGAFNDAFVFPGGVVDAADRATAWDSVSTAATDDERKLRALKVCALRETFEETGVLVETKPGEALPNRRALRNQVHDKPESFVELVKKRKHSIGLDKLIHWSCWLTPTMMPKRFDTHFMITVTTPEFAEAAMRASADGSETVDAQWWTPREACERALLDPSDPRFIILSTPAAGLPPFSCIEPTSQFYQLAELLRFPSWRDLAASDGPLAQPRLIYTIEPELFVDDDNHAQMTYPGDPNYTLPMPEWIDQSKLNADCRHRTLIPKAGEIRPIGVMRRGLTAALGPSWGDFAAGADRHGIAKPKL